MEIDLSQKIADQVTRLEDLADEAAVDESQSYSSRASAMTALSGMLKELEKSQEEIINMSELMKVERITIETVKKYLTEEQCEEFLVDLENNINHAIR